MDNVVYLSSYQKNNKLHSLSKLDLLEEMVVFQEKRTALQGVTQQMKSDGIALFTLLTEQAETPELASLCRDYLEDLKTVEWIQESTG